MSNECFGHKCLRRHSVYVTNIFYFLFIKVQLCDILIDRQKYCLQVVGVEVLFSLVRSYD
jgi:hypothetical protein